MRIMILDGANLNLLGVREPQLYGTTTLDEIRDACAALAVQAGATLAVHQSNHEGVLIDLIQQARTEADALIINPAGHSFTSMAMLDALRLVQRPIYEVHITNIQARGRHSILSAAATGVIAGFGAHGYLIALQAALQHAGNPPGVPSPAPS